MKHSVRIENNIFLFYDLFIEGSHIRQYHVECEVCAFQNDARYINGTWSENIGSERQFRFKVLTSSS